MKLKYETHSKPLKGCHIADHAGYSGWRTYSTSAKTADGLVKRMKKEAIAAFEQRVRFYERYVAARKTDVYDEDHVWHFHTYAPYNGRVIRLEAFCVKEGGSYGDIEFVMVGIDNANADWAHYKSRVDYYGSLVAQECAA